MRYAGVVRWFVGWAAGTALGLILLAGTAPGVAAAATGSATEFTAGLSSDSGPVGITAGPDGNLWFTERNQNNIGRITPAGKITEYPTPTASSSPEYITAGPDGAMWFTELDGNQIGRITTSGQITEYPIPTSAAGLQEITVGPDGDLWFTEETASQIGKIDPNTHVVTEYSLSPDLSPWGITTGPDGDMWFTEVDGNAIGQMTTGGTLLHTFPLTTSPSSPEEIVAGPDGNLWFTESANDAIGRITPAGTITEFPTPTDSGSQPWGITVGPDGNLWFVEQTSEKVGTITTSGTITEFSTLTDGHLEAITSGPDHNLWVTENFGDGAIARVQSPNGAVVPTPSTPPTIAGSTRQGSTLTWSHGAWNGSPTGYTDRWEDCDSAGNNCTVIPGATGQTYLLAARDLGHTIRVMETAFNIDGAGPPVSSAHTAIVVAPAAAIRTAIGAALTPTGAPSKIGAILRNGGYIVTFHAPEGGRAVISWLSGTKLVATGQMAFSKAGARKFKLSLTSAGHNLLKNSSGSVKLTAKGKFTDPAQTVSAQKTITLTH